MNILVRTIGCFPVNIEVNALDTCDKLKRKIHEKTDHPQEYQELSFEGKIIHKYSKISDFEIKDGSTILINLAFFDKNGEATSESSYTKDMWIKLGNLYHKYDDCVETSRCYWSAVEVTVKSAFLKHECFTESTNAITFFAKIMEKSVKDDFNRERMRIRYQLAYHFYNYYIGICRSFILFDDFPDHIRWTLEYIEDFEKAANEFEFEKPPNSSVVSLAQEYNIGYKLCESPIQIILRGHSYEYKYIFYEIPNNI